MHPSGPRITQMPPSWGAATVGQAVAGFTFTRAIGTVLGAAAYVRVGIGPVALSAAAIPYASWTCPIGIDSISVNPGSVLRTLKVVSEAERTCVATVAPPLPKV